MTFTEFYQAKSTETSENNTYCGISHNVYPQWAGWKEKIPENKQTLARNFWYLQYIIFLFY